MKLHEIHICFRRYIWMFLEDGGRLLIQYSYFVSFRHGICKVTWDKLLVTPSYISDMQIHKIWDRPISWLQEGCVNAANFNDSVRLNHVNPRRVSLMLSRTHQSILDAQTSANVETTFRQRCEHIMAISLPMLGTDIETTFRQHYVNVASTLVPNFGD